MALNDDAVLTAGVGYVFIGEPGAAAPTVAELDAVANFETWTGNSGEWEQVGHTSRDDMPEFGFDGGDKEVKGTWQKKRLREIATGDPVADSLTFKPEQFDTSSLELYYGTNASAVDGEFGVDGSFNPVEKALLVVIVDGKARLGFYAAKASISRDDSIDMPVDDFTGLPVKATFLDMPGQLLYKWISRAFLSAAAVSNDFTVSLGSPSAGTFTLTYGGNTTGPIAFDATSSAVKAALAALDDGFTAARWTVTGSGGSFSITTPSGSLSGDGSGLTGGTFTVAPA